MSDITEYRRLTERIYALADRWVRAWDQYCYRGGANRSTLYLGHGGDYINFKSQYAEGGGGLSTVMSIKYLEDDSTLEKDGKEWYDKLMAIRTRDSLRVAEIKGQLATLPGAQALQTELYQLEIKHGWGQHFHRNFRL